MRNAVTSGKAMRASVNTRDLVEKSVLSLPTLPNVFVSILELVTKEETSAIDLAHVIARDQSLTSRVLTMANSACYGFRERVTTVPRATALLGFDVIKNLVLSVSIFDDFFRERELRSFDKTRFWEHCLVCAAVAREISRQKGGASPDEAYVAGLLHDVGKVALDSAVRETYSDLLMTASSTKACSLLLEQEYLATDHAEIAGILSENWTLPESISTALRFHHSIPGEGLTVQQEQLTAIVAMADFICWTHGFGSIIAAHPPGLGDQVKGLINVANLDIDSINKAMDEQIMSAAAIFDLSVPDMKKFRDALMKANVELGHINSLYEEAKHQLELQVRELSCLNRAIFQIRGDLSVDSAVKALLRAIRNELGYLRAMYFGICNDGKDFYLADVVSDEKMEKLIEPSGLDFKKSILLSQSLKARKSMRFERTPEWENDPLFLSLNTNEVFLMPIPSKQGFVGVVVADNDGSGVPAYSGSIDSLNILAQEAGLAIENALLFERTKRLATRDGLTDLYNRRYCLQYLETEIKRSKRYDHPFSIAIFDIDYFKKVNDTFGHPAGDKVLGTVSLLLVGCSRDTDVVGRYGGEEFLVILPETPLEGALVYAERVREEVEAFGKTNKRGQSATNLTISGGVTTFDCHTDTLETILSRVDQALYRAKQEGRNRIFTL